MRGCWAMDPIRKEAPMAAADRSTADPRTRFPLALKLGLALAAVAVATGVFSADELAAHDPDHLFVDFSHAEAFVDVIGRLALSNSV